MIYSIGKNCHYSTILGFIKPIWLTLENVFSYTIKFDKNCLYNLNPVDNWDINKLVGFSGNISHHQQSCRVGWRCLDGENIQLVTYCYDGGKRLPEQIITQVKPEEEFTLTLKNSLKYWTFIFYQEGRGRKVITINKLKTGSIIKFLLFPYFGGNLSTPHKMSIHIKTVLKT